MPNIIIAQNRGGKVKSSSFKLGLFLVLPDLLKANSSFLLKTMDRVHRLGLQDRELIDFHIRILPYAISRSLLA